MTELVGDAVGERLAGGQPSRTKSFLAALVAGLAAGAATYKLLRSSGQSSSD